ncbi:heavy metal translocatin [Hypoxylon crocopeplum]|nr:heavy metal translocatin [Hypoxylon crocopeplum]
MAPSHQPVTTYFLLANLHCPTCVSSIKDALQHLPGITWVSPNIVTSWVAVEHDPDVSVVEMAAKLESSGFEVSSIASTNGEVTHQNLQHGDSTPEPLDVPLSRFFRRSGKLTNEQASTAHAEREKKHLNNCEECRTKGPKRNASNASNALTAASRLDGCCKPLGYQEVEDEKSGHGMIMSTKSLVTDDDDKPQSSGSSGRRWRASMAIGGMTCSNCVKSITTQLEEKNWVTKVAISLVSHSGIVEYIGTRDDANQIVEIIEDTGKDAELDEVINIDGGENRPKQERTIEIRINGFYCDHCTDRAANSLGFIPDLTIVAKPTRQWPILRITYVPAAPTFTIRQILSAIEASDPAFKASIHHPPTLEERARRMHARHLRRMLLRAWFTTIVAIPTFIIGVVYMSLVSEHDVAKMFLMQPWASGISRAQISLCIMATPVYFLAADIFHRSTVQEIRSLWGHDSPTPMLQRFYRFGSMNMLVSLGTTIAYISSISQMIAAAVERPNMVNDANFYFDSVVFLTFFLLWGRVIEAYSKSKTGDAVEALAKLRPTTATDKVVSVDLLEFGDLIVRGQTTFDESSLTGESRPVKKAANDDVFAGTVNTNDPVLVQITGAAGQSMLDQIPAPMEKLADLLTAYFVPFITLIAILTWLIWLSIGLSGAIPGHFLDVSSGGWVVFSLQFAIAVFVVACPCGLALAAPTAIFVGGGEAFEKASRVDCVPVITDTMLFPGHEANEEQRSTFLAALQAIEENSSHPIAKAIVSFFTNVEELPGKGLRATYSAGLPSVTFDVIVGNEALMRDFNVTVPLAVATNLQTWKTEAKSVAIAAVKRAGKPTSYSIAAAFSISDPVRLETPGVISALKARGTDVWMLSGDNATTAKAVALQIGIPEDNVIAGVLPAQKHEKIKWLQSTLKARRGGAELTSVRATVAMVGDGINDAPALGTADVGVAMGSGSDVAIFSADFVLVNSSLSSVVTLLDLSRTVFRRIKFNFAWALVYNMLAVPIAAGCLYPVVVNGAHVRLPPVWASLAMALSSISVVLSSLALRSSIPGLGFRFRQFGLVAGTGS